MQFRLSEEMRKEIIEILEFNEGYFGQNVKHLIDALNGQISVDNMDTGISQIISYVEKATKISYSKLKSKCRKRETVLARQYAMWKIYDAFNFRGVTTEQIGDLFNRDHSTVIHSVKQINFGLETHDYLVMNIHDQYEKVLESMYTVVNA